MAKRSGNYLLALKANCPVLHADVAAFFATRLAGWSRKLMTPLTATTAASRRSHIVCHDVGWLSFDRRDPNEPRLRH